MCAAERETLGQVLVALVQVLLPQRLKAGRPWSLQLHRVTLGEVRGPEKRQKVVGERLLEARRHAQLAPFDAQEELITQKPARHLPTPAPLLVEELWEPEVTSVLQLVGWL